MYFRMTRQPLRPRPLQAARRESAIERSDSRGATQQPGREVNAAASPRTLQNEMTRISSALKPAVALPSYGAGDLADRAPVLTGEYFALRSRTHSSRVGQFRGASSDGGYLRASGWFCWSQPSVSAMIRSAHSSASRPAGEKIEWSVHIHSNSISDYRPPRGPRSGTAGAQHPHALAWRRRPLRASSALQGVALASLRQRPPINAGTLSARTDSIRQTGHGAGRSNMATACRATKGPQRSHA